MVFNTKTEETKLTKIGEEYLERVWKGGKEKSFKLVGIEVDEDLTWKNHIEFVCNKINSALYGLAKTGKNLDSKNKKLMYSGLIHSHLIYGLPVWGFAKAGKLNPLKVKQKKAIRKVFNLKYRDHTHSSFTNARILKLEDLIEHTTLCYLNSSICTNAPDHVRALWQLKESGKEGLRCTDTKLSTVFSHRQWINDLPPNRQARLWNNNKLVTTNKLGQFKEKNKKRVLQRYEEEE